METRGMNSGHAFDQPVIPRYIDQPSLQGVGFSWLRNADIEPSVGYYLNHNTLRQLAIKQALGELLDIPRVNFLGPNLVTNGGDDLMAYTAKGDVATKGVIAFFEYGTPVSQPTPAKTDTTLTTESTGTGYVRKAITFVETPAAGSGSISAYTGTWGTEVTVSQAIFELGLNTLVSGTGLLYNHLGFAVINKGSTQTLTLECDVTIN